MEISDWSRTSTEGLSLLPRTWSEKKIYAQFGLFDVWVHREVEGKEKETAFPFLFLLKHFLYWLFIGSVLSAIARAGAETRISKAINIEEGGKGGLLRGGE